MTQTEALKLALRAMVVNNQAWKHLADSGDAGYWEAKEQGYYQLNEQAIKAVEATLETKDEPVVWNESVPAMLPKQKEGETFIVSYEPKPEAKDEPVVNTDHVICPNCVHQFRAIPQNVQKLMLASGFEPPFTTPPQRTWVSLTNEEIASVEYNNHPLNGIRNFARAIEAKLKEKNQ